MQKTINNWRCRMAPSLGAGFEGTPFTAWGTREYVYERDLLNPTVFFGLYGLPDFFALWKHKGPRSILWAGSDIRHFKNGYWLDEEGTIRISPWQLGEWINLYCDSYVENEVEQKALADMGVESEVVPSFLGNIDDFEISYQHSDTPKLYTSVSGDEFKLYGWDKILPLAMRHPNIEFHLYGSKNFSSNRKNIIVHGRVPKEQMNEETSKMQGALRLTEFDGFSEILAKSILWGQYPVSFIKYPYINPMSSIHTVSFNTQPNTLGRDYYRENLNKYPWNENQNNTKS